MARSPNDNLVDEIGSSRPPPRGGKKAVGAKPQAAGPEKPQRSPMFYSLVVALSVGICIFFSKTVLLIGVSMLPTGVAYLIDTHPRRYTAKTVGWTNFAGAVIVAMEMWTTDGSWSSTFDVLGDPLNWVIMLGSAGVGWVLQSTVPGMVLRYLNISLEMRRRSLHERQEELEKEWGTDVRDEALLEELEEVEAEINAAEARLAAGGDPGGESGDGEGGGDVDPPPKPTL